MTQTLTGLFDHYEGAERAMRQLESIGVSHDDISVVANNAHGGHAIASDGLPAGTAAKEDAETGAGMGATVGGIGGLLAGLGLLVIPGLGPVAAAGWLGATLIGAAGGAAVGAAAGGLVGALTHAGVAEEDAHVYAEGVRRGGSLVTARVEDSLVSRAREVLDEQSPVDIASRRDSYEQDGWSQFDDDAPAYTHDQVVEERTRYPAL